MTWLALAWSVLKRAFAFARLVPWQVYAGLALVAAKHAAWDDPDQDAGAGSPAATGRPPEAPIGGVTRS